MKHSLSITVSMVIIFSMLQITGCVTTPESKSKAQSARTTSSGSIRQISVPSDSSAQYYVLDRGGSGSLRTITTKRVGPSGTSYSKRLYNCSQSTVKYLGTGDTLTEMNSSSPAGNMGNIVSGSIAYYVGLEACK